MAMISRIAKSLVKGSRAASTSYKSGKTSFLLNWYANPYHTPIFVAKEMGWLAEEGIDLAVLETTNPSDVTEIIGEGSVGMGLKAMIHILAAKDRGIDLMSFGTLLNEPPTGLIHPASANITRFEDIVGKKVGYIGHFGKVMIDDLAKQAGLAPGSYETVRVGMNVTAAIMRGEIDTGVGFTNFQRLELEHLTGKPAAMLRIDELNNLGCCCFCSVMYVANGQFYKENPDVIAAFSRAVRRATDMTTEFPDDAWKIMLRANPRLDTPLYTQIFQRSLPYFSRELLNVDRDWNKVGQFCKHLGVLETEFNVTDVSLTSTFPPWASPPSLLSPQAESLSAPPVKKPQ
jgi:ABC-type nitrate/sulfonate/bicarbonate transport system substrate-binding protein